METSVPQKRIPQCGRCRNHGFSYALKGHKSKCKYKECLCSPCKLIGRRKQISGELLSIKRKEKSKDTDSRGDEEDIVTEHHIRSGDPNCVAKAVNINFNDIRQSVNQNFQNTSIGITYPESYDSNTIIEPNFSNNTSSHKQFEVGPGGGSYHGGIGSSSIALNEDRNYSHHPLVGSNDDSYGRQACVDAYDTRRLNECPRGPDTMVLSEMTLNNNYQSNKEKFLRNESPRNFAPGADGLISNEQNRSRSSLELLSDVAGALPPQPLSKSQAAEPMNTTEGTEAEERTTNIYAPTPVRAVPTMIGAVREEYRPQEHIPGLQGCTSYVDPGYQINGSALGNSWNFSNKGLDEAAVYTTSFRMLLDAFEVVPPMLYQHENIIDNSDSDGHLTQLCAPLHANHDAVTNFDQIKMNPGLFPESQSSPTCPSWPTPESYSAGTTGNVGFQHPTPPDRMMCRGPESSVWRPYQD